MKKAVIKFANSKGSGEPAHPRSLARTYAVRSLLKVLCQGDTSAKESDVSPR